MYFENARCRIGRLGPNESEGAVAHAADDAVVAVGRGDLAAELVGESEVERRAPASGQEHDVVVGHVEIADRH